VHLSNQLGVAKQCIFTGHIHHVADYLNVMSVVLHTSIKPEPFGRVVIEAMAMKKPVIASRAGAIPEIIVDGVSGITFSPGNHAELAKAVTTILEQTDNAREIGVRGYQRLLDTFHIEQNVSATEQLYRSLLEL